MFDKLLESNFLIPFLFITLIVLVIIYIILLILYHVSKNQDNTELPKRKHNEKLTMIDNLDLNRISEIEIPNDLTEITKNATSIKGLLKNSIEVTDERLKKVYDFEYEDKNIIPKDEEIKIPKNDIKNNISDIAFSKEILPFESINEDVHVEDDSPKFEKTEIFNISEIEKLLNDEKKIEIKDDTKDK